MTIAGQRTFGSTFSSSGISVAGWVGGPTPALSLRAEMPSMSPPVAFAIGIETQQWQVQTMQLMRVQLGQTVADVFVAGQEVSIISDTG